MKTIGLLGGMSWQSTAAYYRQINALVADQLGGLHSARLLISSVDFAEFEHWLNTDNWPRIAKELNTQAQRLETAGADCLLLATNTMHKVADQISLSIPLLHIADALGVRLQKDKVDSVGILGTRFTMTEKFYADRLNQRFSIETQIPCPTDMAEVDRIIFAELCLGIVKPQSCERFNQIIKALLAQGVQGIALACTELEMLVTPNSDLPLYDTTAIHAACAVNWALKNPKLAVS